MLYDFTYVWNLKSKINKKNKNRLIDTENRLMAARGEEDWRTGVEKAKELRTNW